MTTSAELFALAQQHQQAGGLASAEQLCRQIVHSEPGHLPAWLLLAQAVQAQGNLEGASQALQNALTCFADNAEVHNALANVFVYQEKIDDAIHHYQQALRLNPHLFGARYILGIALNDKGRQEEAVVQYLEAIRLNPSFADTHHRLGISLANLGRFDEAIASYRQALLLNPTFESHYALGIALHLRGHWHEAVEHYRQAVQTRPDFTEAYNNLASALLELHSIDEAVDVWQQVLQLKLDFAVAHCNLGLALLKRSQWDQALVHVRKALRLQPDMPSAQTNLLFCLNYDPQVKPEEVFKEHRMWGIAVTPKEPPLPHANERSAGRRLRVGYVSPDFCRHPLANYFEPVLAEHNAKLVEVFCYSEVARPDEITRRMQNLAHVWRPTCGMTDSQLAQQIRDDQIDILVDLAGHTAGNRLRTLALKPAPIQATWLGYINTTGLTTVDYRLTDDVLDPPDQPIGDTEQLFRLAGGFCCYAPPDHAPAVTPLPALQKGFVTFGSLNSFVKVNGKVYDLWGRVLKAIPTARLLIYRDAVPACVREELPRALAKHGVDAQRLEFRHWVGEQSYLSAYAAIDISLDTWPCSGGVTTCEALWMGAPVISLCGARPAGRHSASLLTRVGLSDWAVHAADQYVKHAVDMTEDLNGLARVRSGLRDRMKATVCDAKRLTRELENAYLEMWRRWLQAT